MTDNEKRPKPRQNVNPLPASKSKTNQMMKMGNFRDQLNKQLFGGGEEIEHPNETAEQNLDHNESKTKKTFKIPPKEIKTNNETNNTNNGTNVFTNNKVNNTDPDKTYNPIPASPITNDEHHNYDDIVYSRVFGSNTDQHKTNAEIKKEPISINRDDISINTSKNTFNMTQGAENNQVTNTNNAFYNLSDENCNSVVLSENRQSELSSNDKKANGETSGLMKITKTTKFVTVEKENAIGEITQVTRQVSTNPALSSTSNKKDNRSVVSLKTNKSDEALDHENFKKDSPALSALNNKLDKIRNELKDIKQREALLESNLNVEVKRTKIYEQEIEELRLSFQKLKMKEIIEGEAMLKLEIEKLKNTVSFKDKENELLKRENSSLNSEVKKLQIYLKNIITDNKAENLDNLVELYKTRNETYNNKNEAEAENHTNDGDNKLIYPSENLTNIAIEDVKSESRLEPENPIEANEIFEHSNSNKEEFKLDSKNIITSIKCNEEVIDQNTNENNYNNEENIYNGDKNNYTNNLLNGTIDGAVIDLDQDKDTNKDQDNNFNLVKNFNDEIPNERIFSKEANNNKNDPFQENEPTQIIDNFKDTKDIPVFNTSNTTKSTKTIRVVNPIVPTQSHDIFGETPTTHDDTDDIFSSRPLNETNKLNTKTHSHRTNNLFQEESIINNIFETKKDNNFKREKVKSNHTDETNNTNKISKKQEQTDNSSKEAENIFKTVIPEPPKENKTNKKPERKEKVVPHKDKKFNVLAMDLDSIFK